MRRREFCRFLAVTAASRAIPSFAQAKQDDRPGLPSGFNRYTQSYEEFCALAPEKRIFYKISGNTIVETKLDETTWQPPPFDYDPTQSPVAGGLWDDVPLQAPFPDLSGEGPYKPTWGSMLEYEAPEWYQDAKFGIWAHWSPQCVPEAGDWYARNMYVEGQRQYHYHLDHYGPQSRFGYKDLCAQWTLLNWQPEDLIARYKRAGARIFVALANHHDNFDAWDSKHQPWNAAVYGPHRDVLGTWARAARNQGLRFGVTVHQARNFYDRTRDLLDQHDPDLLYFDDSLLPLGWGGMNIGAYFYNHNLKTHGGKMEAVLNVKDVPDRLAKAVVADYERGLTAEIMKNPWQSETCIGGWHYSRRLYEKPGEYGGYLPPRDVIHWLIDTVSKNGTFILNIPGKPDGTIDSKEIAVLDGVTSWMQVNGEAIHETRPWKVYGEGPNMVKAGSFQGESVSKLGASDIRFTRNKANSIVYALVLGWPAEPFVVQSLGLSAATHPGRVAKVELIGTGEPLNWKQQPDGLRVELAKQYRPEIDYAAALRVTLA